MNYIHIPYRSKRSLNLHTADNVLPISQHCHIVKTMKKKIILDHIYPYFLHHKNIILNQTKLPYFQLGKFSLLCFQSHNCATWSLHMQPLYQVSHEETLQKASKEIIAFGDKDTFGISTLPPPPESQKKKKKYRYIEI